MGREEDKMIRLIEEKFKALEKGMLSDIIKKQDDILLNQELLGKKYDEIMKIVQDVKSAKVEMESEIEALKKVNENNVAAISNLQWRLAKAEQYSRKNNLEIREVPVKENEDLKQVVIDVVNKVGVVVDPSQIEIVHRLKAQPGNTPAILARLSSAVTVENILKKKRDISIIKEQITGPGTGTDNIFIGPNLSPFYRNLFWKCKTAAKLAKYRYVWMQGTVMIRKETGSKAIKIENDNDIRKFFKTLNLEHELEEWEKIISTPIVKKLESENSQDVGTQIETNNN